MSLWRTRLIELPDGSFGCSVQVGPERLAWFMTLFAVDGENRKEKDCGCQKKKAALDVPYVDDHADEGPVADFAEKPVARILTVAGSDDSRFGDFSGPSDLRLRVVELVANPMFQVFAMRRKKLNLEEVEDAEVLAAEFLQEVTGRPLEYLDEESFAAAVRLFEVSTL